MSPITIDHRQQVHAVCRDCPASWASGGQATVLAVLSAAAEHAIEHGHTVAEHVTDDATIRPDTRWPGG